MGNADEKGQGDERAAEADQIDRQHGFQTAERQQRGGQGGVSSVTRELDSLQPAHAGVLLRWGRNARPSPWPRESEGVHQAQQQVDDIQVPDRQDGAAMKQQHREGAHGGDSVSDEHDGLLFHRSANARQPQS